LSSDKNLLKQIDRYSVLLDDDLLLRGLSIDGSKVDHQEQLEKAFIIEWKYNGLLEAVTYHDAKKDQPILNLMECVPCILHMENR
jgi:hypothetical protein